MKIMELQYPDRSVALERCEWCWRRAELAVTVIGDDQSPCLCDSCTDAFDSGARKYVTKVRGRR